MPNFTDKQKAFIAAYLGEAKYNAVEACRIAGYSHPESSSGDLMREGYKVREEIERRLERAIPSESELLTEMARIALAEHGDEWVKASDKRSALRDLMEIRGKIIKRVSHSVDENAADQITAILGISSEQGDTS